MTPDEARDAEIARNVAAFTSGNDPNPSGRFPGGSYATPDEARERGIPWVSRPGEPQDLNDPWHYQTPDQARANGVNWATQRAIAGGRSPHPAMHSLYQGLAGSGRLGDLLGFGYDHYAGPLAGVNNPMTLGALVQMPPRQRY